MSENPDVLRGADAIARYCNFPSVRAAQYACKQGHIPCFKLGDSWCARKSALDQFFSEKEREALARAQ